MVMLNRSWSKGLQESLHIRKSSWALLEETRVSQNLSKIAKRVATLGSGYKP
jgi:hypothetical protein